MDNNELNARLQERKRAVGIASSYYQTFKKAGEDKRLLRDDLAFVEEQKAEVARYIGNAISGHDALSITLGVTGEEILRQEEVLRIRARAIEDALRLAIQTLNDIPNTSTRKGKTYDIIPRLEKALRNPCEESGKDRTSNSVDALST